MPSAQKSLLLALRNMERSSDSGRELFLPDNPGKDIFSAEDWVAIASAANLSTCEWRTAAHLTEGLSRPRIARKLKVSANTVRSYIDRLFRKLHVDNHIGLVLRLVLIQRRLSHCACHTKV